MPSEPFGHGIHDETIACVIRLAKAQEAGGGPEPATRSQKISMKVGMHARTDAIRVGMKLLLGTADLDPTCGE